VRGVCDTHPLSRAPDSKKNSPFFQVFRRFETSLGVLTLFSQLQLFFSRFYMFLLTFLFHERSDLQAAGKPVSVDTLSADMLMQVIYYWCPLKR